MKIAKTYAKIYIDEDQLKIIRMGINFKPVEVYANRVAEPDEVGVTLLDGEVVEQFFIKGYGTLQGASSSYSESAEG